MNIDKEFKGSIKNDNQWKNVKEYKDVKPRDYKPSGNVKNNANFLKNTESFSTKGKPKK